MLRSITIHLDLPDDVPEAVDSQIHDDARRAAIYRLACERRITFPDAASLLGLSKSEADRLVDGMNWHEDPLAHLLFEEWSREAAEERATGRATYWLPGDPVV